mgnify:CR=1 FL=1
MCIRDSGYSIPEEFAKTITSIKNNVPNIDKAILSAHCHNDLGLAVANALSGLSAGVRQIECTINGIGERAGNAALEEIVMAIKTRDDLLPYETGIKTELISKASKIVSNATGFPVQFNKAIVGKNAFAHESGIHQDGMLKNRETYEIMTPESVGVKKTSLVMGKHSGRHAFKDKLNDLGYTDVTDDVVQAAFGKFKILADKKKHVYDEDIVALVDDSLIIDNKINNINKQLSINMNDYFNLNYGDNGYSWGLDYNNYTSGYLIDRYSNPNVTWEVAEKTNFGLELEINKALNLQVDYFTEHRTQIYMERNYIPESMGLTTGISSNLGEVKSKGIDASMDYNQAFSSGLYITGRANFTYATNEIILNGDPIYEFDNLSRIGYPVNQPFGLIAERLFIDAEDIANSPEQFNGFSSSSNSYLPGDIKYTDLNGDGVVNENDMTAIGSPQVPEIIYGFGISAGYRDFDLSIFMQGAAKVSFFINPNDISPFVNERNALNVIADNHWSINNPDPNAFWPRLSTYSIANNEQQSTWWQRDGDFLRLKNVEIGYTFPDRETGLFSGLNTRVYFSGLNLLTISKFDLWDTEMGGNGLGYPPQKVYNIGLQVNF